MGLDQEKRFHRYHRVLNHASWSSREASRVLLVLILVVAGAVIESLPKEGKRVTKVN